MDKQNKEEFRDGASVKEVWTSIHLLPLVGEVGVVFSFS